MFPIINLPLITSLFFVVAGTYKNYRTYRFITPTIFGFFISALFFICYPLFVFNFKVDSPDFYLLNTFSLKSYFIHANTLIMFFYIFFLVGNNAKLPYLRIHEQGAKKINAVKIIFVSALFGIAATAIFIYLSGGIEYVLHNISGIRSGRDENKTYLGSFIRLFSSFLVLSVYAAFYFLSSNRKEKLKKRIGKSSFGLFIFILCFAFIVKFTEGGRGGLIILALGAFFSYSIGKKKLPSVAGLSFFMCFAIFIIVYGKIFLFQIFSNNSVQATPFSAELLSKSLSENFSYPYQSILITLNKNLIGDRYFSDFYIWLYKPLKLLGYQIQESISFFNTENLIGIYESEIPPGIVAFLLLEGGTLFVPAGAFIVGAIFRQFDKLFDFSSADECRAVPAALYVYLIFSSLRFLINSDPALIIFEFVPLVGMFLYFHFKLSFRYRIVFPKRAAG